MILEDRERDCKIRNIYRAFKEQVLIGKETYTSYVVDDDFGDDNDDDDDDDDDDDRTQVNYNIEEILEFPTKEGQTFT